jgi:5'-deoxynucleotidase YfbR-like HD superfamily hydrolase
VDEFEYIRKIPVYINFSDVGNKEIKTCIKEYLRCSTQEANYLLEQNQIVLLIDNLVYDKNIDNKHQLNRIHNFNRDYEDLQIIATAECHLSNILPEDYLNECRIGFRNYFIKNLRAKEIKSLMGMWVPEEDGDEIKIHDRLDKLVTNFNSFGLPSTAMSVSLFLWSTEYSKREPINSAVLLEIYIEIILDKLNKDNIYRKTFDFTNKLQLLAKIAYEMWVAGELNYSISYSEFARVVENYLKNLVGFNHDPKVIMEYFMTRKIFIKYDSNRIKFSNSCFFHFFLAKRMEFDADFKAHVMEKDEYYKFYRQIDYYTGLKRSDKVLFETIFDRFQETFAPTDYILGLGDIDKYFTPKGKTNEPVPKNIEIKKISDNRPSEELLEEFQNKRLEEIKDPNTIIKINNERTLDRLLIIMANVLRNSEGVEDLDLKRRAYKSLVKYTMVYMILHKEKIVDYVLKNRKLPPNIPVEIDLINYITNIPLFVQDAMYQFVGTQKLNTIILEKIIADNKTKSVSDIESFLSVGLYADLQCTGFDKQFKSFINRLKTDEDTNIVANYCFYKLIDYYYRRTRKDSPNEAMYLDLLSDLRIRVQDYPKRMKEQIIKAFQEAKRNFGLTMI